MKIFYFFILLILLIENVIGTGFSPTSLIYELNKGEKECKMITIDSTSEKISVLDKWAENKNIEWSVNSFDKDANFHGINMAYDNELEINERKVEVCLGGDRPGEYHGVLLLREEQKGNSVVQMGIWLKAVIDKSPVTPSSTPSSQTSVTNNGISNKSKESGGVIKKDMIEYFNKAIEDDLAKNNIAGGPGITGNVVGFGKSNWKIIVTTLIAIAAAYFVIVAMNKKRKKYEYNTY